MIYVSIDGDDIGRLLTQTIYQAEQDHEVQQFSEIVSETFNAMANWVNQHGGQVLFCTGDSVFFKIEHIWLEEFQATFQPSHFTISVGLGLTRKEAHWALNIAKSLGKNRVVHFDQVRQDIFGVLAANKNL